MSALENIDVLIAFLRRLVPFTAWCFGKVEDKKTVDEFFCSGEADYQQAKLRFSECYRRQSRRMDSRVISLIEDANYAHALAMMLTMADGKEGMLVLMRDDGSGTFTGYDQLLLAFVRDIAEACLIPNSVMQEARSHAASHDYHAGTIEQLRRRNTLLRAARRFLITPRECEVVAYLLDGLRIEEISERLFISTSTVNDHVKRLLERTGASNRSEMLARILGWHSHTSEDAPRRKVQPRRR